MIFSDKIFEQTFDSIYIQFVLKKALEFCNSSENCKFFPFLKQCFQSFAFSIVSKNEIMAIATFYIKSYDNFTKIIYFVNFLCFLNFHYNEILAIANF